MADLSVKVCGVEFNNPLIAASGTFGFGMEYSELYPLEKLGGISCKGITLTRRDGNPVPRVAETPSGILNAVGLQNPGVDVFINEDLPWLKKQNTVIIANIAGNTPEDYCAMAEKLSETDVDMIELNISCPNVKSGGVQFGTSCESVGAITAAVKKYCTVPVPDPKLSRTRKRIILEGDVPSPMNPPSGCSFHTRCPYATEKCSRETPVFKEHEPGHWAACHLLDK